CAVTVSAATVGSITVTPAGLKLPKGVTRPMTATANLSDGSHPDFTNSGTWSSSAPSTANIAADGRVTGLIQGIRTVISADAGGGGRATPGGTGGRPGRVARVLSPSSGSGAKGVVTAVGASGCLSDGTGGAGRGTVAWSSVEPTVAQVDAGGHVGGVAQGST